MEGDCRSSSSELSDSSESVKNNGTAVPVQGTPNKEATVNSRSTSNSSKHQ